jgi:hypothetical protein
MLSTLIHILDITYSNPYFTQYNMALPNLTETPDFVDGDSDIMALSFTTKVYRDVYPAIEPSRPGNSQAGKVIVITGASRGLGRTVSITYVSR